MVQATEKIDLQSLYEIDDHLWLEKTIQLLKEKRFYDLDLDNLIEELESLGRRDKLKVVSLTEQIIRHLLLLQYWTEEYQNSAKHWQIEIISFRTQLKRYLTTNLSNYLKENLENTYQDCLIFVKRKTDNLINFPDACPYTLEQILDQDYF
jgi:predicted nucleic acid-binding protein